MDDLVITTVLALTFGLWFWALTDILKTEWRSPGSRVVWLLVIFLFPVLGSIIYFQLKNKYTTRGKRKFQPDFRRE